MSRRAKGFFAVCTVIGLLIEFLENGEQPRAVVEEDILPHDEHVAEACRVTFKEGVRVLPIVRVHLAQNMITALQIVVVQQGGGFPQGPWCAVLVDDFLEIAERRGDYVILLDGFRDGCIVQTVFLCGFGIDIVVHDLTEWVLLMLGFGEIEIATIVAEAIVVGIDVFPCPVLCGQLAVTWVEVCDVFAFIIVERPREPLRFWSDLHRLHDIAVEQVNVFVRGDEDA